MLPRCSVLVLMLTVAISSAFELEGRQRNSTQTLQPDPKFPTRPMDKLIRAQQDLQKAEHVNFFDARVFDAAFYKKHNPQLKDLRFTKGLRRHWIQSGVREGLRASANFDSKVYLHKNPDVAAMYGRKNYPWAIIHYLTVGVHQTWRATGGPERSDIFDTRVFQWKWYLQQHNLQSLSLSTEAQAQHHWSSIGLDNGYQGSPEVSLSEYLRRNSDLSARFGPRNFRAALSYFTQQGFRETWRDPGVENCKFWARWCQVPLVEKLLDQPTALPTYKLSGVAPVAMQAGHSMEINGKVCGDRDAAAKQQKTTQRIEEMTSIHWPSVAPERSCEVLIRHFVDIQIAGNTKSSGALDMAHWTWHNTAPMAALNEPVPPPTNYVYRGFEWLQLPSGNASVVPNTYHGRGSSLEFLVSISSSQKHRLYSIVHHYSMVPHAPVSNDTMHSDGSIGLVREMLTPQQ